MDISKENNQTDQAKGKGLFLPSFLAFLLGISAIYALSLAGNTNPEIKIGQEAYDLIEQKVKVKREKIQVKQNSQGENKDSH